MRISRRQIATTSLPITDDLLTGLRCWQGKVFLGERGWTARLTGGPRGSPVYPPPAFLACAFDDRPDISEGLANVYLNFKKVAIPAELHIYSTGGHGFGFRSTNKKPAASWLARFEEWLGDSGFVPAR